MKITYIGHSGFLVETDDCYYIFDYYRGVLPRLQSNKPVFVFSSHAHHDHYTPEIFRMLYETEMESITAVLSDDISSEVYPRNVGEITIISVSCHRTYNLPCNTTVYTLRSTDEGVAFLLRCSEGTLYHAGDLNDWVWSGESEEYNRNMTENYRLEIDRLNKYCQDYLNGLPIDAACIPLDPRQEEFYACGMLYFLRRVLVSNVYPMHFWGQPEIIDRFCSDYPEYAHMIQKCSVFK